MPVSYLNQVDKDVLSSLEHTKPLEPEKSRRSLFIMASLIFMTAVFGIEFSYYYFYVPNGKIIATDIGQRGRIVEIQGCTRNVPLEQKYLWVVVDIPSLNLCWPKRQIYTRNAEFRAKFIENGPNPKVMVSLYALNSDHHLEI